MLNLNSLMVGTDNPKVMSEFYQKVFDKDPDMVDGDNYGWQVGGCFFGIGEHSEVKGKSKEPSRIIINLETTEVQTEFDRIKEIEGVKVIKEPYDMQGMMIATFEDPDGNYFQLMSPWES
jgi:predicted enzyme related to lactoylglutathione lyase